MLYSNVNAYTPLEQSRIYDADVIFASVDNILKTPPRTRLFRPQGFDPERWLFSMDEQDTPFIMLNDVYDAMGQDDRLTMLYNANGVTNDPANYTIKLALNIQIKGFDNQTFQRTVTVAKQVPT